MLCVFVQICPADKAYFIAKELLSTERTYLKDLELITAVNDGQTLHQISIHTHTHHSVWSHCCYFVLQLTCATYLP